VAQPVDPSGWESAVPDPDKPPTRRSIAVLEARLAVAEAKRAALLQRGDRLVSEFKSKYPDSPAYLVRYADRTLNDYRWRLSGKATYRDIGLPGNKTAVELTGETGKKILASLPQVARVDWLRFEAWRQAMNYESAMTKYEVMRLRSLIERQELLRQLVREGGA
jgi:hypothetical protein